MKISVMIDSSGSMQTMGKPAIIQSFCRDLLLHDGFEFDFHLWNGKIEKTDYGENGLTLKAEGKNSVEPLVQFINDTTNDTNNLLLLTDGFIDGDVEKISSLVRDNKNLKFRIVGIGSDFDLNRAKNLFPKNMVATTKESEKLIFYASDTFPVLESFYLENVYLEHNL